MANGFVFNMQGLWNLTKKFSDPALIAELNKIPATAGVSAIISQAIADNFEKEGPGWAPLKASTLRATVKKSVIKKVEARFLKALGFHDKETGEIHKSKKDLTTAQKNKLNKLVDKQLVAHEKAARSTRQNRNRNAENSPNRKILNKTGLLKKTATIPNFTGSNKSGQSGSNLYKVEGTNLTWGTNLSYAGIHNKGCPERNIPKREFMVVRPEWQNKLNLFIAKKTFDTIKAYIIRGRK